MVTTRVSEKMMFGFWRTIKPAPLVKGKSAWICECTRCGTQHIKPTNQLLQGTSKQCRQCYWKAKIIDIKDVPFSRLIARSIVDRPAHVMTVTSTYWLCDCICGNTHIAAAMDLKNGNVQSCGCLQRDMSQSHVVVFAKQHGISIKEAFEYLESQHSETDDGIDPMIHTQWGKSFVIGSAGKDNYGKRMYWIKCICGSDILQRASGGDLRLYKVTSCGCSRKWN